MLTSDKIESKNSENQLPGIEGMDKIVTEYIRPEQTGNIHTIVFLSFAIVESKEVN